MQLSMKHLPSPKHQYNRVLVFLFLEFSSSRKDLYAHIHVIYVPSVKNQYKRVVFGYMVIY